jgi:hypothetical protein
LDRRARGIKDRNPASRRERVETDAQRDRSGAHEILFKVWEEIAERTLTTTE